MRRFQAKNVKLELMELRKYRYLFLMISDLFQIMLLINLLIIIKKKKKRFF